MRILSLDFRAFGPFTGDRLDFRGGAANLHLIEGPNEAGKSSALRALKQLLYGIPERSTDDFVHQYKSFLLGATLQAADGQELTIYRRKGRKSLLAADEKTQLPETALAPFLGGVSQSDFERLFALDHTRLVSGGKALASGGGEMGESLFAAGAGIANLGKVKKTLEEDAARLFLGRGTLPLINKALVDLKKTRETRRQAALSGDEWQAHDNSLSRAKAEKKAVDQSLGERRKQLNRLTRIQNALSAIARRRALLAQLRVLAATLVLPEDFADRFRDASEQLRLAEVREGRTAQELEEVDESLRQISLPETLLEHAADIERLHQELAAQRKATRERHEWSTKREHEIADASAILREIRPGASLEDANNLRLSLTDRVRINDLGNQHQMLAKARIDAQTRVEQAKCQLDQARRALSEVSGLRDAERLKRAVAAAVRQRPLDDELKAALAEYAAAERQALIDLAKLPLWKSSWEALERLPVPPAETIDEFRERMADDERRRDELQANIKTAGERARTLRLELERLEREGEVPTESDLQTARQTREQGWRLVLAAWQSGRDAGPDVEAYLAVMGSSASLSDAYERSVAGADLVADRLRREAERVQAKASTLAELDACERLLATLNQQLGEAELASQALRAEWESRWQELGIGPLSPKEMAGWIRQHSQLAVEAKELRRLQNTADILSAEVAHHQTTIDAALVALGEPEVSPEEALSAKLDRALRVIENIQTVNFERDLLRNRLAELESDLPNLVENLRRTDADEDRWRDAWSRAMSTIGLDNQASPSEANAAVNRITTFIDKLDRITELRRAIERSDRESDQFASDVRAVYEAVSRENDVTDYSAAVEMLHRSLADARRRQQERDILLARSAKYQTDLRESRQNASEHAALLDLLRREAGDVELTEIPARIRASSERRSVEERLSAIEEQIASFAGGASPTQFIADAEREHADELPTAIAHLEEELAALEGRKEDLFKEIANHGTWIASHDGTSGAAESDEDVEDVRARIEDSVTQYVPLKLATTVLDLVIERYRQKNQDPVLDRAGSLFAQLTGGSFKTLEAAADEKHNAILVGIRASDHTAVKTTEMSDGTADQLFLALRLAIVENFLESHEHARLPLVLDDILINFDNTRAAAALHVLLDLAQHTQVLFFTHHHHLIDLARAELGGAVPIHRLGTRTFAR
jgi:uncharacterized protein YhaN